MDARLRDEILPILDRANDMTLATIREDGHPQATTVSFANEGLTLYFLCGLGSQKATNLARDDRMSLMIDHDTSDIMAIAGLSMAGHVRAVTDPAEAGRVTRMLVRKYPEQASLPGPMPGPEEVRIFRVTPTVISVLDYSKGFEHTDLATVADAPRAYRTSSRRPTRYPFRPAIRPPGRGRPSDKIVWR